MKEALETLAGPHSFYTARRSEYAHPSNIPFRTTPRPFGLNKAELNEIRSIGQDVTSYMNAVNELYFLDGEVKSILDTGKPEIFRFDRPPRYLFFALI